MMRSLYSGVAGLKTHQTKMDVIGNNIANVNTVGFKGSSVNFSDTFYQTMSSATGSNAATGTAGTNAKQIGLGSNVAAITTNITDPGGMSTTNRALDIAINGDSFLVVKSAGATYFTKSGALNVDDAGNLYCTTNGATVQGWLADENGNIIRDTVKDLVVKSADNMFTPPTATENITMTGNIDKNDEDLQTSVAGVTTQEGFRMTFSFYDKIGEGYTVQMYLQSAGTTAATGTTPQTNDYNLVVSDVCNSDGESIFVKQTVDAATGTTKYELTGATVSLGGVEYIAQAANPDTFEQTGEIILTTAATTVAQVHFNTATGDFQSVTDATNRPANSLYAGKALVFDVTVPDTVEDTFNHYSSANGVESGGVEIDMSNLTQYSKGGTSNTSYYRGATDEFGGGGAGNVAGEMAGIAIDELGRVVGTYTNGEKKVLAQIAVTTFSNPSGLEAVGNSMFAATLNSGLFDGVGEDIVSTGGKFTVGALEMSNVDLASEFTQMITTQRGFQANSRIITTSDSMLEELVNLKR